MYKTNQIFWKILSMAVLSVGLAMLASKIEIVGVYKSLWNDIKNSLSPLFVDWYSKLDIADW